LGREFHSPLSYFTPTGTLRFQSEVALNIPGLFSDARNLSGQILNPIFLILNLTLGHSVFHFQALRFLLNLLETIHAPSPGRGHKEKNAGCEKNSTQHKNRYRDAEDPLLWAGGHQENSEFSFCTHGRTPLLIEVKRIHCHVSFFRQVLSHCARRRWSQRKRRLDTWLILLK